MPSARVPGAQSDIRTLTTAAGLVDVYSRDPGFLVAVAGRYVIPIVKDRGTMMTVSLMRRALDDMSAKYEKFGYLGVIEADAQPSWASTDGCSPSSSRSSPAASATTASW